MKKFRNLAIVALFLLALGSFWSVAFAKENGNHNNDRNRNESRRDKENNADDKGMVTDDGNSTVTDMGESAGN